MRVPPRPPEDLGPVERLDPDRRVAIAAFRFLSSSSPGRTYDVSVSSGGIWSCECWVFLEKDRCKHISAARRIYAQERNR